MATARTRPDPRKLTDDELELFRAFHLMRRGFDRTLDAQLLHDDGISISELEVLMALVRSPGRRLRVRDLVDITTAGGNDGVPILFNPAITQPQMNAAAAQTTANILKYAGR